MNTSLSASIMKLTPRNGGVREVKYTDLRDERRLVWLKEQWLHSIKAKRWERGNKEKEERGSRWAAGLVGTDLVI